jgi:NAD(P)H-hydrate epimerase
MPQPLDQLFLTVAQTRRIDQLAADRYHIPSIVLMENAARSALAAIQANYPPDKFARVAVLVGAGNNGGDGLALARLMHNGGYRVRLLWAIDPADLTGDAAFNRDIALAMELPGDRIRLDDTTIDLARAEAALRESDLVIDALLGTGLKGAARPPLAGLIELVNELPDLPVVALDVPSGFDADAGLPADDGRGASIIAAMTISFAANKLGYRLPGANHYTGRVLVGDIGVPRELVEEQAGDLAGE